MIKIFLAHSTIDKIDFVNIVAEKLKEKSTNYTLWYYDYHFDEGVNPMDQILKNLCETDLFVLFISQHSLSSPNVKKEVKTANKLHEDGCIKKIESFLIDSTIIQGIDNKIPYYIKKNTLSYVNTPEHAVYLIEKSCSELQHSSK